eukprot:gene6252-8611_t
MSDYDQIYEPSDDSFLFCDTLLSEKQFIMQMYCNNQFNQETVKSAIQPILALEVGCGSGCIITYLSMLLRENRIPYFSFGTDINPHAATATAKTAVQNEVHVEVVLTNLVASFNHSLSYLSHSVDVLLFNPPYVPTPSEEILGNGIEASWAGGIDGREVIDKFLPCINDMLSPRGACYMILVEENKPTEIASILATYGLQCKIVTKKQARNECLMVMKIMKK